MSSKELYHKRKDTGLCVLCGKYATHGSRCEACYVRNRKWLAARICDPEQIIIAKEIYRKRKDAGLCVKCEKPAIHGVYCAICYARCKNWVAARTPEQKAIANLNGSKYQKRRNLNLKIEVFAAYGRICKCCGESDIRFLTMDHVNGGGGKQRKELFGARSLGGIMFYRWLKNQGYPEGFQILCWNCNSGRQINHGVCPHKDHYNEGVK